MAGEFENSGLKTFVTGIESSARRLKSNIDAIIEKYNKPFAHDDEIDLSTMTILKDRGCVRKIRGVRNFGASQLKSTKRKDELFKSRIDQLSSPVNPNVSMAIARRCVSYINDTNVREAEPSDAETLSSDTSNDDDENSVGSDDASAEGQKDLSVISVSSVTDNCDEDVGNGSSSSSDNDEDNFTTIKVNRLTLDSSNDSFMNTSIRSRMSNLSFVSIQSPRQKSGEKFTKKLVINPSDDNSSNFSQKKQMAELSNNTFTLQKKAPCNVTISTKDLVSDYCLRSRSSANRKSNDSVQRQNFELNTSKRVSAANISQSRCDTESTSFLIHKSPVKESLNVSEIYQKGNSTMPSKSRNSKSMNKSMSHINISESSFSKSTLFLALKSPVKNSINQSEIPRNYCRKVNLATPSKSSSNTSNGKSISRKTLATQNQIIKGHVLRSQVSPEKHIISDTHPQKNSETFLVSSEAKNIKSLVQSSPQTRSHIQTGQISESKFKSPQGIKVKRICPVTLRNGKSTQASQCQSQFTSSLDQEERDTISFMKTTSTKGAKSTQASHLQSHFTSCIDQEERGTSSLAKTTSTKNGKSTQASHLQSHFTSSLDSQKRDTSSIMRTTSTKDGKSTQASQCHSQFTSSLDSQKSDTSSVMRTTSTKDTSFNQSAGASKLRSHLERSCKRTSADSSTFLFDVSFSSSEGEDRQDDVSQNCNVLLESVSVPISQIQNGGLCTANKTVTILSAGGELAKNFPGDTSLTSSLKHLQIHPHSSVTSLQSSYFAAVDNSVSEKQSIMVSPRRTTRQHADEHVTSLVNTGLFVGSPVRSKQTRNDILQNCRCNNNSINFCQDGQQSGISHGFDQKKWLSVTNEKTSLTNSILSPTHSRLKRKASGSNTSGYYTEAYVSPECLQSGYSSSLGNSLTVDKTFTLPSVCKEHSSVTNGQIKDHNNLYQSDHALSCCLHKNIQSHSQNEGLQHASFQNDPVKQRGAKTNSICSTSVSRNSNQICDKNMERKYAVANRKLRSCCATEDRNVDSSLQTVVDNHYRVCGAQGSRQSDWKKNHHPLSHRMDQRICEWVEASNKAASPGTSVHYSSCLPKLQHSFLRYPQCLLHHICNICGDHSKAGLVVQRKCNALCRHSFSETSNHVPSKQQSLSCINAISSVHCMHCTCQSVCRRDQRTDCEVNRSTADICLKSCQHQNCNTSCHIKNSETCRQFEKGVHDCLKRRAHAAWEEIQAERSDLDNESIHDDRHVSDSLSSIYQSECASEVEEESNHFDSTVIHGTKQSSQLPVPRISSFLKSSLDKVVTANLSSRSFVEAHSPAPKVKAPKSASSTKETQRNYQHNNVMFPDSYIEQFSPLNPSRIDSDASILEREQIPPVVKECFKNFRPRRHYNNHSPPKYASVSAEAPFSPPNLSKHFDNQIQFVSFQSKPSKRRNVVSHSPSHSRGQFNQTGSSNYYTQKKGRNCSTGTKLKSGKTSPAVLDHRASTPVKNLLKMPELFFDDSISTVALTNAVNGKMSDEESRDSSSIVRPDDALIQDWDSNEDVNLL